jgi:hypothetical protein
VKRAAGVSVALVVVALLASPALAQRGTQPPPPAPVKPPKGWKPPIIDMGGMDVRGRLRGAELLYFLERADAELERARLERRSFIPELVRTVAEEAL